MYRWRAEDKKFAAEWMQALSEACDVLEEEARRRAVFGTMEPVYFKGEAVGTIRRFSDVLLIFLMKAADRKRFDPQGFVQLSTYEDLATKQRQLEDRMDALVAERPAQPNRNPER